MAGDAFASIIRWLLSVALTQFAIVGCRSDGAHPSTRSVGVLGSTPAAPPELPNDQITPTKTTTAQHDYDISHKGAPQDGGLVYLQPTRMREESHLAPDSLSPRDSVGVSLEAEWKAIDWPPVPNTSEIERDRLIEIRNKMKLSMRIDLIGSGRMRLVLSSRGYAFEKGTELRARVDLLGHVLVWPDESQYRILPAGTLRSLFQEGLADVGPVLATSVKPAGTGHWLDWETERVSLTNPFGHLVIDQSTNPAAGVSGRLLCRWLLEFISAEPSTSVCQTDMVPVRAQFEFAGGGKLEFVATQVSKKQEYGASSISVPPSGASFNPRDLPRSSPTTNALLAEHRSRTSTRNVSVPPAKATGLVAANHTLGLRVLFIDGVAAAWLMPGEERSMPELLPGSYTVAWRDFLGLAIEAPKSVTLPARIAVGVPP
jgi:hypothetical protein